MVSTALNTDYIKLTQKPQCPLTSYPNQLQNKPFSLEVYNNFIKTQHNLPMEAWNDIFNEQERQIAFYFVYDLFGGRPFQQVFPFIPIQEEKRKQIQEDITCEESQKPHQIKNDQLQNASSLTPDNIFAGESQPNIHSGHQFSGGRGDKYSELQYKIVEDGAIAQSLMPDNNFADESQPNIHSGHQFSGGREDKYSELQYRIVEDGAIAQSLIPDNIFADESQPNLLSGHQFSGKRGDKYPELQYRMLQDEPFEVQKNNNMVKKLLKTLNKVYYTRGRKFFKDFPQIQKQMNSLTKNHRRKYSEDKNFNNNLNAMKAMFSQFEQSCQPAQRSFLVRKMAHSLIRTEVIPSVLANNQVKSMKKSYLFGLKVQMLRSRSKQLMERTEIH